VVAEAAHVFVEPVTLAGIEAAVAAFRAGGLRQRLVRHHGGKTDAVFAAWADTWLAPAFRGWNVEAELRGVTCPVLVLQGEGDQYGTAAQVDAIARGVRGPVETALLAGCGHAPHHEAPAEVIERVAAFLEHHAAAAAVDRPVQGR
jgi:pimeloyl-ACP methyl ester carboxylesterase